MHTSTLPSQQDTGVRVSTLELFFDLVFVFIITQISHLIAHAHDLAEVGHALMALTLIWWMYGGYAWLTNNVGTTQLLNRLLVLVAMAAFLIIALAVPQAFGRDGLAFGLAYLVVNIIHAVLFSRAPDPSSARAIWRIGPFNIGTALLVVIAGLVDPAWGWFFWYAALLVLASLPFLGKVGGFTVQPAHFVERHGLVLIIALGESIVSIGVGAAGEPITPMLITAVVLTLALLAALWWSYFDRDERQAEHAMSSANSAARARMGLYGFGYAHLIMIAGVVLLAAGVSQLTGHLHEPLSLATGLMLASGVGLYLLGDVGFRWVLRISSGRLRLAAACASLLSLPLGLWAGGIVQVGALLLIVVVTLIGERAALRAT
jgi:low temperature requirement protein LtrA